MEGKIGGRRKRKEEREKGQGYEAPLCGSYRYASGSNAYSSIANGRVSIRHSQSTKSRRIAINPNLTFDLSTPKPCHF